jgi:Zn-dependent protease with chaperone function
LNSKLCNGQPFLLPSIVLVLSAIIHFLAACLLMALANWAGLISWRRAVQAHWTERARLLWPVRFTANISIFIIPFLLLQIHWYLLPALPSNWIADGIASFFGAVLGCYPFNRQVFPQLDFKSWLSQTIAWLGMQFGTWIVLITGAALMPEDFGGRMILVAGSCLLVHCLLNWGLFLRYLRLVRFLKPAGQRLEQIVEVITAKMGDVKVRRIWEMNGSLANAFVFPTTRELVFSRRALEICTDEEVTAICAHEIAHLKESKFVLAARLFGSLTVFPLIFINPSAHLFGPVGFFVPYLLMLVMLRFTKVFSQRMEKQADEQALKEQGDEGVYARSLEKLYRENQSPAINVNNRQTHPHLYDRMVSAGITPDFPRPKHPKRLTLMGWSFVFAAAVFILLALVSE